MIQKREEKFTVRVWPLIIPQVNWPKFLGMSNEVLGRKISEHLDLQSQKVMCPVGFLSCLGNFANHEHKNVLLEPWMRFVNRQLTFGFLVQGDEREVYSLGLDVVPSEERTLFVISATLERWIDVLRPMTGSIAFRSELQKQISDLFSLMGIKI